jgi:hypothetical protein
MFGAAENGFSFGMPKRAAIMHVAPSRQQSALTATGITWHGVMCLWLISVAALVRGFMKSIECSWNVHFVEVMKKVERPKNMLMPVWKTVMSVLR